MSSLEVGHLNSGAFGDVSHVRATRRGRDEALKSVRAFGRRRWGWATHHTSSLLSRSGGGRLCVCARRARESAASATVACVCVCTPRETAE